MNPLLAVPDLEFDARFNGSTTLAPPNFYHIIVHSMFYASWCTYSSVL
jgi:hypothetical protein